MSTVLRSGHQKIMYIGFKDSKVDNITPNYSRTWNGLGDIVEVEALDAQKLCTHQTVFLNVTGWDDDKLNAKVKELQEIKRARERQVNAAPPLSLYTDAEIAAEYDRRFKGKPMDLVARTPIVKTNDVTSEQVRVKEVVGADNELAQRPETQAEVVDAISATIMNMDNTNTALWDEDGNPTKAAVEDALGYQVSRDELNTAIGRLSA